MSSDSTQPVSAPTTGSTPLRRRAASRTPRLVVLWSPDSGAIGTWRWLEDERLAIGRVEGWTIEDREISRLHATITRSDGLFEIHDAESRNGTIVNGDRVERALLEDQTILRLGSTLLLFEQPTVRRDEALDPERGGLVGPSLAMQRVRGLIRLAATRPTPVLLTGETGVGKELAAALLHADSGRTGPFLPLNAGGLPEALVEAELFGHVAGAFTGAKEAKTGLIEAANGGTLFLDELGEMPLTTQAKLLRVIDQGELRKVGDTRVVHVDVRFVAATNRALEEQVERGLFRGDLYARVARLVIEIPPLRARKDDVLPIARRILEREGCRAPLDADVAEALVLHDWPFNVRSLEAALASAWLRGQVGGRVGLEHLPEEIAARVERRASIEEDGLPPELLVRRDVAPSREDLARVLDELGGNISRVAEFFGKDRRQIYRWAEKHGIDLSQYREG